MARRLLNFASAVSLVLCVAVCALWVRSYAVADRIGRYTGRWEGDVVYAGGAGVMHDSGGVMAFRLRRRQAEFHNRWELEQEKEFSFTGVGWSHLRERVLGYPDMREWWPGWRVLGFGCYGGKGPPPLIDKRIEANDHHVVVPYWFLAAATMLPPAAWARRRLRESSRLRRGLCPACGYDLRATPERCPECGKAGFA